jgi:hypothetical protein
MYGCFAKVVRKAIIQSYKIQRKAETEPEKKGGKK